MILFRIFLVAITVALSAYSAVVVADHGLNLLPIFFGDMAKFEWPGQFNLDFMFMLALSAVWVSWRHRFSALGIFLGLLAFIGGSLFLGVYLLVQSVRVNGDPKLLLLGKNLS